MPASKLTEYITSNSFAEIYNYLRHEHFCDESIGDIKNVEPLKTILAASLTKGK